MSSRPPTNGGRRGVVGGRPGCEGRSRRRLAYRVTDLLHFPAGGVDSRVMSAPVRAEGAIRVLVVDDDADTRLMLREALRDAGYAVECAAHGYP